MKFNKKKILLSVLLMVLIAGTITPALALRWPVTGYPVSQGYHKDHHAMDIASPTGTPVYAMGSGKVVCSTGVDSSSKCPSCNLTKTVKDNKTYSVGMHVIIEHTGGYKAVYHHLSKALVKTGETVSEGQKIALTGNTGYSLGSHLHFWLRKNGVDVNPLKVLTPFRKVDAIDITKTSATLEGYLANYFDTNAAVGNATEIGCYLGESESNMRKVSEKPTVTRFQKMWYGTKKWFGDLKPGTTYYYKLYVVYRGETFYSATQKFTTIGDGSVPVQPPAPPTSTVKPLEDIATVSHYDLSQDGKRATIAFTLKNGARTTGPIEMFLRLATNPQYAAPKKESGVNFDKAFYPLGIRTDGGTPWTDGQNLLPGQEYVYKFKLNSNGVEYESKEYRFTTLNPAPVPPPETNQFEVDFTMSSNPVAINGTMQVAVSVKNGIEPITYNYLWKFFDENNNAIDGDAELAKKENKISFVVPKAKSGSIQVGVINGDSSEATMTKTFEITEQKPILQGDANDDGIVEFMDAVAVVNYLLYGNLCKSMENADANQNGEVEFMDAVWVVNYLLY